ncbi:MAG: cytochrome B6, partial [Acidobacteria bacterium]|nr:cytochrome B6 [Acidobacteriota bacterium]
MKTTVRIKLLVGLVFVLAVTASLLVATNAGAQDRSKSAPPSSFMPVIEEPFEVVLRRDKANKPRVMAAAKRLLEERYDLTRRVDSNTKMTRGKP